jgi:hypothetical protein
MDARLRTYFRELLSQYRQSWRASQIAMALIALVCLVLSGFLGLTAFKLDQTTVYAGCAVIAILYVLSFGQFRVWQTAIREIGALKEAMRPKLEFTKLIDVQALNPSGLQYDIEIKNAGSEPLDKCLVKVEKIDVTDGPALRDQLPVVLRTLGQIQGERKGSFNLRPGECKPVSLVFPSGNGQDRCITIGHESGLMGLDEIHRCILHVVGYGSSSPATARVEVWLERGQNNRIVARLLTTD